MIGKYSKVDWSKDAPEGTTHVGVYGNNILFYKQDGLFWWFWADNSESWVISEDQYRSDYTLYSKDEDLKMKEVKSISDLEVGMFLNKQVNPAHKRIVISVEVDRFYSLYLDGSSDDTITSWDTSEFKMFTSWSYIHNGQYTPIIHEPVLTPEQLKINELEQTIANASKQLEELKGLRNDNSNN